MNTLRNMILLSTIPMLAAGCGNKKAEKTVSLDAETKTQSAPVQVAKMPATRDPKTILEHMVMAYRNAGSMETTLEADSTVQIGRPLVTHQTTTIRYESNPPRLAKLSTETISGTLNYFADGSNLVIYRGRDNTYRRLAVAGSLQDLCKAVNEDTPQVLNPIAFLTSGQLPEGLESIKLGPDEKIGEYPVYVIHAKFGEAYLTDLSSKMKLKEDVKPVEGDVELWVDKETGFLRQASTRLAWKTSVPLANGTSQPVTFKYTGIEKATSIKNGVTFKEDDFRFVAPKGSREVYSKQE